MFGIRKIAPILAAAALLCLAAAPSFATAVTFELKTHINAAVPMGGVPWAILTFDDEGSAGSVKMTIEATNLVGAENIQYFGINLNPALDPTSMNYTYDSGVDADSVQSGADLFQGGPYGGFYDVWMEFATDEFFNGDTSTYVIDDNGANTLTASDFAYTTSTNAHYATARIHGIGDLVEDGWIAAPEPSSLLLLSLGLPAIAAFRRRRS